MKNRCVGTIFVPGMGFLLSITAGRSAVILHDNFAAGRSPLRPNDNGAWGLPALDARVRRPGFGARTPFRNLPFEFRLRAAIYPLKEGIMIYSRGFQGLIKAILLA